jgi:hypothetical protein
VFDMCLVVVMQFLCVIFPFSSSVALISGISKRYVSWIVVQV